MDFLPIALFVLLAFATGGATAFFFVRDRAQGRARSGAPGPDALTTEVRAIGVQIDNALAEQRVQGETQRMVLSQKIDVVRQTVDTQRAQVQVLQSELRHESQRRDSEIAEIHDRLASIQSGPALGAPPALALEAHEPERETERAPEADVLAGTDVPPVLDADGPDPVYDPVSDDAPAVDAAEPEAGGPALDDAVFTEVTFEDVDLDALGAPAGVPVEADAPVEDAPVEDAGRSEPSAEPVAPEPDGGPLFHDVTFDVPATPALEDAAPPAGDGPAVDPFEAWSPTPPAETVSPVTAQTVALDGSAWIARPTSSSADPVVADDLVFTSDAPFAPAETPPFEDPSPDEVADIEAGLKAMLDASVEDAAPEEPEPSAAPAGADDLTVISSIDDDVQRLLYGAGVTKLDEIAQWGRTAARRYSAEVSVSEETIMTQWIFEAQAALFSRYADQAGQ